MGKMKNSTQVHQAEEEEVVQRLTFKDKVKKWWSKNKRWILPVAGVLSAAVLAVIFGNNDPDEAAEAFIEPENHGADEKDRQPIFDPELFRLFPPGDCSDRLPQSVLANSVGMSSRQFGLELRKLGLLNEYGGRTSEGEQYGDYRYNKKGYPYNRWDPNVARMIGDPDAWAEFVRQNREMAGLDE